MVVRLDLTGCEYDLNNPNARLILRDHLAQFGFFDFKETKGLFGVFEFPKAEGEIVKIVVQSIRIFDAIKTGRNIRDEENMPGV